MTSISLELTAQYWQQLSITKHDIEFLENHLFETEIPLNGRELTAVLVGERLRIEREGAAKKQKELGTAYLPEGIYKPGQTLVFHTLHRKQGKVITVRPGKNPQIGPFDVLEVQMEDGTNKLFAASLSDHKLNQPIEEAPSPDTDPQFILSDYGDELEQKLSAALASDENIAQVAGRFFPRSLLMDINSGHLNLAEAVIEMASGQPLSPASLIEQIDLTLDANIQLTEFSLNYALQTDGRFDEVGPVGQVLWGLRRLEPDEVQNVPAFLQYSPVDYNPAVLTPQMLTLEAQLDDELSNIATKNPKASEATLTLTYPHWRTGTIPISARMRSFFPTADYAPRIRFTLVDGKTGEKIPAWVVRENAYVFGLRAWYEKNKLIPGAYITVKRSNTPGEVIVEAKTRRPVREWIRTVLAGSDGGLVFALLKQEVGCEYNERMAIVVPDMKAVDAAFSQTSKGPRSLDKLIRDMLRELAKLTPQGHVHAEELYSAVNILRRIPPAPLFAHLTSSKDFVHVGDMHFRLSEAGEDE
jgi:hypothetical protein